MDKLWAAVAAIAGLATVSVTIWIHHRAQRAEIHRRDHDQACRDLDELDRISASVKQRSHTRPELDAEQFSTLVERLHLLVRKAKPKWKPRHTTLVRDLVSCAERIGIADSSADPDWKLAQGVAAAEVQMHLPTARIAINREWGR